MPLRALTDAPRAPPGVRHHIYVSHLYPYPNGYSVRSYGYGVGKSTPQYTCGEPYLTCELPFVLHPRSNLAG